MSRIGPVSFVCFALPWLLSSLGYTPMTSGSYYERQLSDHGYGQIIVFEDPQQSAARTTRLFTTSDTCQVFYDTAFFLNDNAIEAFANKSLDKLASAMRLTPSVKWSFYRNSSFLKTKLDHFDRTVQYIGMYTTLVHAGQFAASKEAPRTFVSDDNAIGQDCFFDVRLQYFIVFDAPMLIHILVLDTTSHCGSPLKFAETWGRERINQAALKSWINNNLGTESDYQQFFQRSFYKLAGSQSANEIDRVHRGDTYQELVTLCDKYLDKQR